MNHTHLHTRLLALLLCCALVLPLSACGEAKSTTQQIFAMDTVMDLTAYGKKADDGINAAISIINSMDTLLDPENERSKTYEINHAMSSPSWSTSRSPKCCARRRPCTSARTVRSI